MSRIPTRTTDSAPPPARSLLESVVQFSPTGQPLNLHAQMAHSPAVLVAYSSIRKALSEHGTLAQPVGAALMVASAGTTGSRYAVAVTTRLALAAGWEPDQIESFRSGSPTGDARVDALAGVVREAAAYSGLVSDETWAAALTAGWKDDELAEAFGHLGLTLFTAYFLNYAQTELDLPAGIPAA